MTTFGWQPSITLLIVFLAAARHVRNGKGVVPVLDADHVIISADDPEVRKEVKSCATNTKQQEFGTLDKGVFKKFSSWQSLRCAIAVLIAKVRPFKWRNEADVASQREPDQRLLPEVVTQATNTIIKAVQHEAFKDDFRTLTETATKNGDDCNGVKERKTSLKKSHFYQLDPYVDDAGVLRAGGCLCQTNLTSKEKHPVLLPKGHHVSKLLLHFYHEEVQVQLVPA